MRASIVLLVVLASSCGPRPVRRYVAPARAPVTPAAPARAQPTVETRVDEFTGRSAFILQAPLPPESGGEDASIAAFGSPGVGPVLVHMLVTSPTWRYLRCDSINVLADGAPVAIESEGRDDGHVGRGYVTETLLFTLPWESVVQVASARGVRIRICNDVYALDESFTHALGDLSRRMFGDGASSTAAP